LERRLQSLGYRRSRTGPLDLDSVAESSPLVSSGLAGSYKSATPYTDCAKRWTSALDSGKRLAAAAAVSSSSMFTRDSWKRTNQRFHYSRFTSRETFL
jgi:hypothetical protein